MTVGLPEARLPLANAVILVATSPKSNSAHDAINAAMADVERGIGGDIPRHLQNKLLTVKMPRLGSALPLSAFISYALCKPTIFA